MADANFSIMTFAFPTFDGQGDTGDLTFDAPLLPQVNQDISPTPSAAGQSNTNCQSNSREMQCLAAPFTARHRAEPDVPHCPRRSASVKGNKNYDGAQGPRERHKCKPSKLFSAIFCDAVNCRSGTLHQTNVEANNHI